MSEETKACPHCGETIAAQAVLCRFCRTDLATGKPAGTDAAPPKKSSGPVVLIILACVAGGCVVFGGLLAAILLPAIVRASERAKVVSCANNLSQLWKMQTIYMSVHGGPTKSMPPHTGADFWRHLTRTPRPLVDASNHDIFLCPVLGSGVIGKDFQYYGPGKPVHDLESGEPVGSDDMEGDLNGTGEPNHGTRGGNILRKSGDVIEIGLTDWDDLDSLVGGGAPMTKPIGK